jgi:uncharacterized protein DUF3168
MPTAVISVREMLADVIKYDSILSSVLSDPKVRLGFAKPNSALPYVVLGQTTETPEGAGYYRRPGHLGTEAIHCWAKSRQGAQQIFARLSELLDAQRPIMSGHVVMKGVLEYVTDQPGEQTASGDVQSWQVIARYRVRSLVGA